MEHVTCDMGHVTNDTWHVTCDMRHVTCDMWHMLCGIWREVNIPSKLQVPSSYGLEGLEGILKIWRKRMNELMNELMNHKGLFTRHGSPVGSSPNQCNPVLENIFQNTITPKQFQIETC